MADFLLRRLVFGLVAMFVALSLSFYYFASKYFPLRGTSTAHAYRVWLQGIPTGRSADISCGPIVALELAV